MNIPGAILPSPAQWDNMIDGFLVERPERSPANPASPGSLLSPPGAGVFPDTVSLTFVFVVHLGYPPYCINQIIEKRGEEPKTREN